MPEGRSAPSPGLRSGSLGDEGMGALLVATFWPIGRRVELRLILLRLERPGSVATRPPGRAEGPCDPVPSGPWRCTARGRAALWGGAGATVTGRCRLTAVRAARDPRGEPLATRDRPSRGRSRRGQGRSGRRADEAGAGSRNLALGGTAIVRRKPCGADPARTGPCGGRILPGQARVAAGSPRPGAYGGRNWPRQTVFVVRVHVGARVGPGEHRGEHLDARRQKAARSVPVSAPPAPSTLAVSVSRSPGRPPPGGVESTGLVVRSRSAAPSAPGRGPSPGRGRAGAARGPPRRGR